MYIQLQNINKTFGTFWASQNISFQIEKGKLVALLGPSGSGKTTILRMIAGLEYQDSGDIYINGSLVNDIPVSQRGIGFVFQNYALFPYYTVYDNIAYGLKLKKVKKEAIRQRVSELLELVGLQGLEKRYPSQLSGGQRQRVAFARALAPNPQVLLLDEPFAAVDAKVRQELRTWLKDMIRKIGITSIFVTHDQDEAVEVADEIIVTNLGRVEQKGDPEEIYKNPRTPFVAKFIGQSSVVEKYGALKGFVQENELEHAVIRPEFVKVIKKEKGIQFSSAYEDAQVTDTAFRGNAVELTVRIGDIFLKAIKPLDEQPIEVGEAVQVLIYRLYAFNENQVILLQNDILKEREIYYI